MGRLLGAGRSLTGLKPGVVDLRAVYVRAEDFCLLFWAAGLVC